MLYPTCNKFQLLCNMIYVILELRISYRALVVYKGKQNIIFHSLGISCPFAVSYCTADTDFLQTASCKRVSPFFFTGAGALDDLLLSPD